MLHQDIIKTATSSSSGYVLDGLTAGYYTVVLSKEGYITVFILLQQVEINVSQNNDYTISPILSQNEIRIVLTWGQTPRIQILIIAIQKILSLNIIFILVI